MKDQALLEKSLAELDAMIGLDRVKREVREILALAENQEARQRHGLCPLQPSLHLALLGNPGTAKTTVARLMANILHASGILPTNTFIELDRSGIVGKYLGSTEQFAKHLWKRLDKGGTLFIDEAYALAVDYEAGGSKDFGKVFIDLLVKFMEDKRDKVVVIVAGYEREMKRFLNSNPGLPSRVTQHLHFEDYNPHELSAIFAKLAADKDCKIDTNAKLRLAMLFHAAYAFRNEQFSNGRLARNIRDAAAKRLAARVKDGGGDKRVLSTLTADDIGLDLSELEHIDFSPIREANPATTFTTWACPQCHKQHHANFSLALPDLHQCSCGKQLIVPWWAITYESLPAEFKADGRLSELEHELVVARIAKAEPVSRPQVIAGSTDTASASHAQSTPAQSHTSQVSSKYQQLADRIRAASQASPQTVEQPSPGRTLSPSILVIIATTLLSLGYVYANHLNTPAPMPEKRVEFAGFPQLRPNKPPHKSALWEHFSSESS